ncbi:hypothetical protein ACHAQH_009071 [Verticillium albo-atrum]
MRWYVLAIGVFATLVDSTPQHDLCAGYCSVKASCPPTPESTTCSAETIHMTETITETRVVTETKQIPTTVEPTTERVTTIVISTIYTDEYASTDYETQITVESEITSYPATITTSLCTPKPSYGLSLGADLELIDVGLAIQEQQSDCVYYTTTVWKTTVVEMTGTAVATTHVQGSVSTERSTDRVTEASSSTRVFTPSAESSANAYTSLAYTTSTSVTACPAPTNDLGDDTGLPYDPNSNRTFGCVPRFVCDPPKPRGCNIWTDSPADDYVCKPNYCIPSPPYSRVHWPEGETGYVPPDKGYFNLNPHAFGLPYSVFEYKTIVRSRYGKTYTITTGNWASATDLSVFPTPSPLVGRRVPSPRHGLPSIEQRQEDSASTAPAVCFDDCNNCYKEALAVGKSPTLCMAGSQFRQDYRQCITCIDTNVENGPAIRGLYIDQKFDQFLRYCNGQEPIPANSTSRTDTPTAATSTSELFRETSLQLPGETSTSIEPIDLTPTTSSTILGASGTSTRDPAQELTSSSGQSITTGSGNEVSETTMEPIPTSVDRDELPIPFSSDETTLEATLSSVPTTIESEMLASLPEGSTDVAQPSPTGDPSKPITLGDPASTSTADSVEPTEPSGTGLNSPSSSATASPSDGFRPGDDPDSTGPRQSEGVEEQPTAAVPSLAIGTSADLHAPVLWMLAPLVAAIFMHQPI